MSRAFLGSNDLIILENNSPGQPQQLQAEEITFSTTNLNLSSPLTKDGVQKKQISNLLEQGKKEEEGSIFSFLSTGLSDIASGAIDFSKGLISDVSSLADESEKIVGLVKTVREVQELFADEEKVRQEVNAAITSGQQQELLNFIAQSIEAMNAAQRANLEAALGIPESQRQSSGSGSQFQLTTPMVVGGLGVLALLGIAILRK